MKAIKNLLAFSAAILMTVSMGPVYAEDGDMTRTRTQTQVSIDNALQAQKRNQNQHRYNYRNNYQTQESAESRGSMSHQMNDSRSGSGGRRKK